MPGSRFNPSTFVVPTTRELEKRRRDLELGKHSSSKSASISTSANITSTDSECITATSNNCNDDNITASVDTLDLDLTTSFSDNTTSDKDNTASPNTPDSGRTTTDHLTELKFAFAAAILDIALCGLAASQGLHTDQISQWRDHYLPLIVEETFTAPPSSPSPSPSSSSSQQSLSPSSEKMDIKTLTEDLAHALASISISDQPDARYHEYFIAAQASFRKAEQLAAEIQSRKLTLLTVRTKPWIRIVEDVICSASAEGQGEERMEERMEELRRRIIAAVRGREERLGEGYKLDLGTVRGRIEARGGRDLASVRDRVRKRVQRRKRG
ncbi:hypothetical protein FN846DRAFT_919868 [Sphaerosporella brunnea]|uniref:Uncharacterized protein n=1 Tax=Sphaerosporella brunnea TaxID=1250544 RepID=A0A5J5EU03_9PEZI|nr:hypothetical protein FN846DRAFT_919868 [Sphaerosporella brunnea]